jgi:hypothetical protein
VKVLELITDTGIKYSITCRCGFQSPSRATLAGAGAEVDAHQAQRFPRPSERRECADWPSQPDNPIEELREALEKSVKLQTHYAGLLNIWDGGQRMYFKDADEWLARLRYLRDLKPEVKP